MQGKIQFLLFMVVILLTGCSLISDYGDYSYGGTDSGADGSESDARQNGGDIDGGQSGQGGRGGQGGDGGEPPIDSGEDSGGEIDDAGEPPLVDETPPGAVSDLEVVNQDERVTLTWTNPPDDDLQGVRIVFKTDGAYPDGPEDGTVIEVSAEEYVHQDLTNGTLYRYSVFAYDEAGNFSEPVQVEATPADGLPPGAVIDLTATAGDEQVTLTWTNPPDGDLQGVRIVFKTDGTYPEGPEDGTVIEVSGQNYEHLELTNGTVYQYAVYAFDEVSNFSAAERATATPVDTTATEPVTDLRAIAGNKRIDLSWTIPADPDRAGILVVYKAGNVAPADPEDGTVVELGASADGYAHTALPDEVTYSYAVFTFDEVPNFSSPATAAAATPDTTAPGMVGYFYAAPIPDGAIVYWSNPTDADFAGVLLRYKTGSSYPTNPSDGTQIYQGTNTSFYHLGLSSAGTYRYSIWAYDEVPNYSNVRHASATPSAVAADTLDQESACDTYGYRLNTSFRWQEFRPAPMTDVSAHYVMSRLEIEVSKVGTPPADLRIFLEDTVTAEILWDTTVQQPAIPAGTNWLVFSANPGFSDVPIPYIVVVPDRIYRLNVTVTGDTPGADYYAWRSSLNNNNCYPRGASWIGGGDFHFRTYRITM